ncbi:MAG: LysM peptidoglycan-binding domain-containing protein [Anaerolineales bacterium]|nr:LysM peptidoglycan-binding domain-containing protein [Anaerolineales bacterium]
MKNIKFGLALLTLFLLLAACAGEPEVVEVTRVVTQEQIVEVEVTRLAEVPVTVEVPVEVTRVVEVVVTASPMPTETAVPDEVPTEAPTEPAPTATATALPEGNAYTIALGDTLSSIATKTGSTVSEIMTANNLSNDDFIAAGQTLFIPGWNGVLPTAVAAAPTSVPAAATATTQSETPPVVAQNTNLLPNPSFEGDWYFHIYNELQIPDGWQVVTDEGANTLDPGSGGLFNRPEIRVVPFTDLPPAEQSTFILNGSKTLKAFKGGAPTSFSLFTDITLQPGSYRFQVRFVPDTVVEYNGGQKVYSPDPLAAEVRIIHDNGGTAWQGTQSGQANTVFYDFILTTTSTVRLGASFRNRYIMNNNGWFIDDWSLVTLGG